MFSNPLNTYYPSYNYPCPLSVAAGRAFAIMASNPLLCGPGTQPAEADVPSQGVAKLWAGFQCCLMLCIIPLLLPHHSLSPYVSFILSIKAGKFSSYCMKCVESDVLNGNEMCFILVAGALFSSCEQGNKVTLISQLGSFSLLKLRWSSGWWHYPVWHCDGRHMILHTCQNP